ncbi:ACN9 family protein, partial [Ostertagia ostertagi]
AFVAALPSRNLFGAVFGLSLVVVERVLSFNGFWRNRAVEVISSSLRLHCGLPAPARLMGDSYVKDEFRRHKDASPEYTTIFLNEWTNYCVTLSKQLSTSGIVKGFIGKDLEPEKLDSFAEEQLRQLLELKLESERMKSEVDASKEASSDT